MNIILVTSHINGFRLTTYVRSTYSTTFFENSNNDERDRFLFSSEPLSVFLSSSVIILFLCGLVVIVKASLDDFYFRLLFVFNWMGLLLYHNIKQCMVVMV